MAPFSLDGMGKEFLFGGVSSPPDPSIGPTTIWYLFNEFIFRTLLHACSVSQTGTFWVTETGFFCLGWMSF